MIMPDNEASDEACKAGKLIAQLHLPLVAANLQSSTAPS